MEAQLKVLDSQEDERALKLDPELSRVRPGNETVLLKGDPQKIVFILHGFIASPYEVRPLGNALNAQGYTVIMPLLSGFGRSTNVAASSGSEDWLTHTRGQLEAAQLCLAKVQVIGFSLGALVETRVLLDYPALQDKIGSFTLVAPALIIRKNSLLSASASVLGPFNSTPRVTTLASMARRIGNHDLDIPEAHPDFFNTELPLSNIKQLTSLAASVDYPLFAKFKVPIKVIYSETDRTVDGLTGAQLISEYASGTTTFAIPLEANVPHQILLSNSPEVVKQTITEVTQNFR